MESSTQLLEQHFSASYDAWVQIVTALRTELSGLNDEAFVAARPATKFVLSWMRSSKAFHTNFGGLFGRIKRPPQADEFTAAVAIALQQFLAENRLCGGRVASEETTHRSKGATRPDISVYSSADKLLATIECKTNLGWSRKEWKNKIESRASELQAMFPDSESFLCVLTQKNWDYKEFENSPFFGKTWFCLSSVTVGQLSDPIADAEILLPLEPMFLKIRQKLVVR